MSLQSLIEAAKFIDCVSTTTTNKRQDNNFIVCLKNDEEDDLNQIERSPNSVKNDNRDVKKTRSKEAHKNLEKNRRAHIRDCYSNLIDVFPMGFPKRPSNLDIIQYAIGYIQILEREFKRLDEELRKEFELFQLLQARLGGTDDDVMSTFSFFDDDVDISSASASSVDNNTLDVENTVAYGTDSISPIPILLLDHQQQQLLLQQQQQFYIFCPVSFETLLSATTALTTTAAAVVAATDARPVPTTTTNNNIIT
ncbi:hypothetical protein HELRODRAFT_194759 [Helobdella robusta]|uniref:BHLH domain-containing protein n=1 Tax=Helobdella robusta TaxID=6412 RepID=T1FWD7_HELRO|nr:hypothetical protein HELRODRAFT_194759 [Helobdella robusta]ESN89912.1 hypothetical protein HELRODRAFT_194759 [Helobdella robusta]